MHGVGVTIVCVALSPGGNLTCERREPHGDTGHVWVLSPQHIEPAGRDR